MTAVGDRALAGLLSALAEAPDYEAASSYLLSQLVEIAGSPRGCLFRLDPAQDVMSLVACVGFDDPRPTPTLALGDLSNPIVLTALALFTIRGEGAAIHGQLDALAPWVAIPLVMPRVRAARERMSAHRARDIAGSLAVEVVRDSADRHDVVPAGAVVLQGPFTDDVLDSVSEIIVLASPLVARRAALSDARDLVERLTQQRDRLTLMVDSLPDPVVITSASNDIIVQNDRAERLLHARDDDSAGRRRAIELNNLLFTSFLSKAAMTGGLAAGPRELNLVDPDEGNDLLFEVLAHPLGERVGPEDAVLSVLRDVTDLRRAANELERQVQRVRQGEVTVRGERDRLNLVLENVADPILVTDERSNIILMNDMAEQLFEIREAETRN